MANETRAITWLLGQSEYFEISIERRDWIKQLLPGWTDIRCTFNFKDLWVVSAYGAGPNEDLALCKAFAEAAERGVFLNSDNSLTTNGFAAHLDPESARKNAALELQERDLFCCHFLTNTPFNMIDAIQSQSWDWMGMAIDLATSWGFQIRFYKLGLTGVLCVGDGRGLASPLGFVLGASYKLDLETSALSACIETFRSLAYIAGKIKNDDLTGLNLTLFEFLNLQRPTFAHHGQLALNVDYANTISHLFPNQQAALTPSNSQELDWQKFKIVDLKWPYRNPYQTNAAHDGLNECPFYFAKATSSLAQGLFLGAPDASKVNIRRLRNFLGLEDKLDEQTELAFNTLPHPFD